MVTSLWTWWSTTAPLGENEAECHPSPICSNIFPLSVIMKHLFCINIHESWSLHLIGVINQYAKHFIFCIISEYSGKLWTGCPWWSASSGSSATSPQSTFSRFHQLEGGACSDLLSCKSPKATISEDKIDLKANLWFQVFNAKQIIISVSLICVKLFSNFSRFSNLLTVLAYIDICYVTIELAHISIRLFARVRLLIFVSSLTLF